LAKIRIPGTFKRRAGYPEQLKGNTQLGAMTMKLAIWRLGLLVLCLNLIAGWSVAQTTLSPPRAEYFGQANGTFELRNDGDRPLAVMLEVRGFTFDDKEK
jgi:P pilus assembly chaperone PapD